MYFVAFATFQLHILFYNTIVLVFIFWTSTKYSRRLRTTIASTINLFWLLMKHKSSIYYENSYLPRNQLRRHATR